MKANIHPKYYEKAEARCACGKVFDIGATKEKIEIEVCSGCHPFFTGREKLVDAAGRVEKFKARKAKAVPRKGKGVRKKKG